MTAWVNEEHRKTAALVAEAQLRTATADDYRGAIEAVRADFAEGQYRTPVHAILDAIEAKVALLAFKRVYEP